MYVSLRKDKDPILYLNLTISITADIEKVTAEAIHNPYRFSFKIKAKKYAKGIPSMNCIEEVIAAEIVLSCSPLSKLLPRIFNPSTKKNNMKIKIVEITFLLMSVFVLYTYKMLPTKIYNNTEIINHDNITEK